MIARETHVLMHALLYMHADDRVSTELKKQIIQARTAKKLTQAQLAQVRATRAFGPFNVVTVSCEESAAA